MPSLTPAWWVGITVAGVLLVSMVVVVIYHFTDLVQKRTWTHIAIFLLATVATAGAVLVAAVRFNLVASPW